MLLNEITKSSNVDTSKVKLSGNMTYKQIAQSIQKAFPELKVEIETTPDLDVGEFSMGAEFDVDTKKIILYPQFSKKTNSINWTDSGVDTFRTLLNDVIKHERLHSKQFARRNYIDTSVGIDNRDANYEYMSRPDEIEAYAMNIADELIRKAGKDGAIDLLRMANKTAQFKDEMGNLLSPNLLAYLAMWNYDSTHPVLKRLYKKTYQYITEQTS
tara:strand:+ start:4126 stop:4767 length:642 start_codon:yes stop_codon:yes gene_type:complete